MTLRGLGSRLRARRMGGRTVVAALAITGSITFAAPAVATAAVAPTGAPQGGIAAMSTDEVGPLTAEGCTGRNGPGNINQSCVKVFGTGTYVERIRGWMHSFNYVPSPITLCDVKVNAWGTYANGARFNYTGTAACSFGGNAWVDWYPRAHFKDGTTVCARTQFKNEWSNPACVQIRR